MNTANDSLSIILPVRNAQAGLVRRVELLVEAAAELTRRFDVWIVDDGSDDATEELAWELARRYAQVNVLRLPVPTGPLAAVRSALQLASGQYVVIHDGTGALQPEDLSAAWRGRHKLGSAPATNLDSPRRSPARPETLNPRLSTARRTRLSRPFERPTALRLFHREELAAVEPLATAKTSAYYERIRGRQALAPTGAVDPAWPTCEQRR